MQAGGRYKLDMDILTAGNWVLLEGIDASIIKTSTLISSDTDGIDIFRPIDF